MYPRLYMAFADIFLKPHYAVNFGEYGVIAPHSYIDAWVNNCAQLAHYDAASRHYLSAIPLDAASLTRTVAAIAR